MRFIKLVNMELNRLTKILIGAFAATLILQMAAVLIESNRYMNVVKKALQNGSSKGEVIESYGYMTMNTVTTGIWFTIPVALCAGAIFFYIFLIWYRDWTGKNTFIYRLLMLPTSRLTVYLSKTITLMLIVLGLVAFQLALLPLEMKLLTALIPVDFFNKLTVANVIMDNPFLSIIIPGSITEFILYYGMGFISLTILFTAVLLERSFQWKGIILAILYVVASLVIFFAPVLMLNLTKTYSYFYPSEQIMMLIGTGVIVGAVSILFSRYLLNKKVTV